MRTQAAFLAAIAALGACSLRGSLSGLTGAQCQVDSDCAGAVTPCQSPSCEAGACIVKYPLDNVVPSQLVGDCISRVCDGTGSVVDATDAEDVYDDANECTDDVCQSGKPVNEPNAGMCLLDGGQGTCDPASALCVECLGVGDCATAGCTADCECDEGNCRPKTCKNGDTDLDETDVDCGGVDCSPCDTWKHCEVTTDCISLVCEDEDCTMPGSPAKCCQPPACTDTVKNGDEPDVDCGGSCPTPCADGAACKMPSDCASKVCLQGICKAPTCTDGALNDQETDIDCGGKICGPCLPYKNCLVDQDCLGNQCRNGYCNPNCQDGIQNNGEPGVDCGIEDCPPCAIN